MTIIVEKDEIETVVKAIKDGCIVAFPTDTVYGIGVDATNKEAAEKMRYAKIRPETKPFPVMVADLQELEEIAELSDRERAIVNRLTPGALTLILKNTGIDNGLPTVAVRIPDDEFVLNLLKKVGPMYVTSANISGEKECNVTEEVYQQLNNRIDYIVSGAAYSHVSSTIIDCTGEELKVLRQGEITLEEIKEVLK